VQHNNGYVVHGTKIIELLNHLKSDKCCINNDKRYNDFVFDLNNLITFVNHNKYNWTAIEAAYGSEYFNLLIFLFDIYSNETTNIFKIELTNKIFEMLNS
jgi:hypothetical protein